MNDSDKHWKTNLFGGTVESHTEFLLSGYKKMFGQNPSKKALQNHIARLSQMLPVVQGEAEQSAQQTLDQISDLFRIGKCARTPAAILSNVENVHRFAQMLHAIEREFFMVEGKPDEDYPDDEPQPECLLNCWGSTVGQYVEQFRKALSSVSVSTVSAEQQSCPVCKGIGLNPLVDVPVTCANCHGVQPSGQQSAPSSQNVVLLHKSYGGESIYEATRDFAEAFDENFNDQLKAIPEHEHGIFRGKFTVHVMWSPE